MGTSERRARWRAFAVGLGLGSLSLYCSVRLVRVLEELSAARAEAAICRERLRASRELHDQLGQSLSAVSLKGDLALALLRRDPEAAHAEIAGLAAVAREALRDVRAVTRDEHTVSLRTEVDGAAGLLAAAGIEASVDVEPGDLPAVVEGLLAWAVREGVTNVLRHSEADTCSITAARADGVIRLGIENDGAASAVGEGSGLAGLSARARELGGKVTAARTGNRFRLVVEVPQEAE